MAKLKPDMTVVRHQLADVLLQLGKTQEAVQQLSIILKEEPDSAEAHHQMSVIFRAKKDKEGTIQHLRQIVRLKPDQVDTLNELSWLLAIDSKTGSRGAADAVRFARQANEMTGGKNPEFFS